MIEALHASVGGVSIIVLHHIRSNRLFEEDTSMVFYASRHSIRHGLLEDSSIHVYHCVQFLCAGQSTRYKNAMAVCQLSDSIIPIT